MVWVSHVIIEVIDISLTHTKSMLIQKSSLNFFPFLFSNCINFAEMAEKFENLFMTCTEIEPRSFVLNTVGHGIFPKLLQLARHLAYKDYILCTMLV